MQINVKTVKYTIHLQKASSNVIVSSLFIDVGGFRYFDYFLWLFFKRFSTNIYIFNKSALTDHAKNENHVIDWKGDIFSNNNELTKLRQQIAIQTIGITY